jgi:hypothetical protein
VAIVFLLTTANHCHSSYSLPLAASWVTARSALPGLSPLCLLLLPRHLHYSAKWTVESELIESLDLQILLIKLIISLIKLILSLIKPLNLSILQLNSQYH